jgi:hypothetical protein
MCQRDLLVTIEVSSSRRKDDEQHPNPASNRRSTVPRLSEINKFLARIICHDLGMPVP